MPVEAGGGDENGCRQPALDELPYAVAHRAAIRVVDGDCHSRPTVAFFIESIERRYVRDLGQHIELVREIALGDEQRAFAICKRPIGNDPVIGEDQALVANPVLGQRADSRRREQDFDTSFQESAHHHGLSSDSATGGAVVDGCP